MRSASIIGYHGMENFGDDLFLDITADLLTRRLQIERIHLSARDIPATLVQTAAQLRPMYPAGRRITRLDWLRQWQADIDSELVVYSAGSIFAGPQFAEISRLTRLLKLSDTLRGRKTPLIGIGISLGPFQREQDRRITADGLRAFDALLLRDQSSVDEAARMGLSNTELSQDLVPMLAERLLARRTQSRQQAAAGVMTLGLSLGPGYHHWSATEWAEFGRQLGAELTAMQAQSAKPALELELELRIFTTCNSATDGDRAVAAALQQALQRPGLTIRRIDYSIATRDAFLDALLGCDGLISSRLHPALVAMGTGIPVMQLSATSPKITGVYARIGLQPIVLTRERLAQPQQWREFFTAIAGHDNTRVATINADNQAAFRQAGAACATRLEQLLANLSRPRA
jgi:polysaccharide pyruvyl transferase WcaK-like protein